jgi:hypothetical protein
VTCAPVDGGVEVTEAADRSLVAFSSGSVVKPLSAELAAEEIPDASPDAVSLALPAAAEVVDGSWRVIVSQGA